VKPWISSGRVIQVSPDASVTLMQLPGVPFAQSTGSGAIVS
jgi:hypothetical protein